MKTPGGRRDTYSFALAACVCVAGAGVGVGVGEGKRGEMRGTIGEPTYDVIEHDVSTPCEPGNKIESVKKRE